MARTYPSATPPSRRSKRLEPLRGGESTRKTSQAATEPVRHHTDKDKTINTSQKHVERLHAALGIMFLASVAITVVLAISGSHAWDSGFAAGQEYESWFHTNTVNP